MTDLLGKVMLAMMTQRVGRGGGCQERCERALSLVIAICCLWGMRHRWLRQAGCTSPQVLCSVHVGCLGRICVGPQNVGAEEVQAGWGFLRVQQLHAALSVLPAAARCKRKNGRLQMSCIPFFSCAIMWEGTSVLGVVAGVAQV